MAHPNERRLREFYEAFARGDFDAAAALCTDDVTWEVPGRSLAAARYAGKSGLLDMVRRATELSGGTFREEILDLVANDERGIVLVVQRLVRAGRMIEYRTAHLWEIRGGKFSA